jgi:hypothetical protein
MREATWAVMNSKEVSGVARRRFRKPFFNDHVTNTKHAAEHHVHAEYAGQYPVGIANRIAFDLFLDNSVRNWC